MKNYLNIFGVVAFGVLVTIGSYQKRAPKPVPDTTEMCFVNFRKAVVQAWADGSKVSFETDAEAQKWINDRGLSAFKDAFAPVRQREQDALGQKYDDAVRQSLWSQFAKEGGGYELRVKLRSGE